MLKTFRHSGIAILMICVLGHLISKIAMQTIPMLCSATHFNSIFAKNGVPHTCEGWVLESSATFVVSVLGESPFPAEGLASHVCENQPLVA